MESGKFTGKVVLAAGSLAGLTTAGVLTEAALIHVSDRPVSLSATAPHLSSVTWDVDGDSVGEFRLWNKNTTSSFYGTVNQTVFVASNTVGGGRGNGRGLVAPFATDNVQAVFGSEWVGASRTFGNADAGYYQMRNALKVGSIGYDFNNGFSWGNNYVGFRFDAGSGYQYGVANFNFNPNGTLTIRDWWYDDTGAAVHVIPEPSALALLAMGAAGIAAYRATRKPRPESKQCEETSAS